MTAVHIDTHIAMWLYDGDLEQLAPAARHLEGRELRTSPLVLLELQYLFEIGRLSVLPHAVLAWLNEQQGLKMAGGSWPDVIEAALPLSWTRDPFDRLIAAHALVDGAPLVTADRKLRAHCPHAVWG